MYYRHEPGRVSHLLSWPELFVPAQASWRTANAVVGRFGTEMTVVVAKLPSTGTRLTTAADVVCPRCSRTRVATASPRSS